MKVFNTRTKFLDYLNSSRGQKTVGFIPTMGGLHSGHLKLIKASKKECEITICSIFVNPTQFNNNKDFEKYPNTLEEDILKLQKLNCDIIYTPTINQVYDQKEKAKEFNFGTLASSLEGEFRPGHFNGMATVVEKFFNLVKPTKAFFGQKDLQQLQIVKQLAKQINSPIEIKGIETVREKNGLAKSSRNSLLSDKGKENAALIYYCLNYCSNNKEKPISELKEYIHNQFNQQQDLKLEYFEIVNLNTMLPINKWQRENNNAICIAAYVDQVRLIDNIIL
tara:strand:+ start:15 stop:851 length:837 start_codon:yes stop_codon:yes gene_type:complete